MKLESHKNLEVWKKSIDLVDQVYKITKGFPKSETYALASQMQRAAVAIPSNIAEGYNRNHRKEYVQFLSVSLSSAAELDTQVIIAKRQYSVLDYSQVESLLDEVKKMLYVLISKLRVTLP